MPIADKPGLSAHSSIRSNVAPADHRSRLHHPGCPPHRSTTGGLRTRTRDRRLDAERGRSAARQASSRGADRGDEGGGDRTHPHGGRRSARHRRLFPLGQPGAKSAAARAAGANTAIARGRADSNANGHIECSTVACRRASDLAASPPGKIRAGYRGRAVEFAQQARATSELAATSTCSDGTSAGITAGTVPLARQPASTARRMPLRRIRG